MANGKTMRAFTITEFAHPSEIKLTTDAPEPELGRDEVLIDVYSAGLNFFDVRALIAPGRAPELTAPFRSFKLKGMLAVLCPPIRRTLAYPP